MKFVSLTIVDMIVIMSSFFISGTTFTSGEYFENKIESQNYSQGLSKVLSTDGTKWEWRDLEEELLMEKYKPTFICYIYGFKVEWHPNWKRQHWSGKNK